MSDDSYDGSVSVPRKLTEEELHELRITVLPYFHAAGGLSAEDITEFLDYAFAMVSNNKSVDYVIKELISMEMDFCNEEVAKKVGKELATFVNKINNKDNAGGGEEAPDDDDDKGSKGSRVVSLKVKNRLKRVSRGRL